MPLIGPEMKSKFQKTIKDGLKREFSAVSATKGYSAVAEAQWEKLANAISDIALDIVMEITTNAQVLPGIPIAGVGGGVPGPVSGATTAPGKIA
jgi:hypothetical protein